MIRQFFPPWNGSPSAWLRSSPWYVRLYYNVAFAVVIVLAISGCNTPRPVVVLPPAELATCADEPAAPVLPARDGTDATQARRDTAMLNGYLALRSAYGSCKAKVDGLAKWREAAAR